MKEAERRPHPALNAPTPGAQAEIRSGDVPPGLDFLERSKGTLPETITESNLGTLNEGLGFLFAQLREARRRYDEEGDGGRAGAFMALGAIWKFIVLFDRPHAERLHTPILRLLDALAALEENNVLPIVKPVPRPGRAPSSHGHAALKGQAAATVKRLTQAGVPLKEAHKAVARELNKLGVRPERGSDPVTSRTVRNWCGEVASDVGRHGTAALMCADNFTDEEQKRFSALSKVDAKRFALASLAGFVRDVFPDLQEST